MENLNLKKVALGVGSIAVLGVTASAFAASITAPDSNAGQGVAVTDGFTVTNVEYDSAALDGSDESLAAVTEVEFDITRDEQDLDVLPDNASVFVQLRDGTVNSDWVECTVGTGEDAGHAICDTSATGDTINMEDIDGISVVAYDDLD